MDIFIKNTFAQWCYIYIVTFFLLLLWRHDIYIFYIYLISFCDHTWIHVSSFWYVQVHIFSFSFFLYIWHLLSLVSSSNSFFLRSFSSAFFHLLCKNLYKPIDWNSKVIIYCTTYDYYKKTYGFEETLWLQSIEILA